jgi:hypothetical protein
LADQDGASLCRLHPSKELVCAALYLPAYCDPSALLSSSDCGRRQRQTAQPVSQLTRGSAYLSTFITSLVAVHGRGCSKIYSQRSTNYFLRNCSYRSQILSAASAKMSSPLQFPAESQPFLEPHLPPKDRKPDVAFFTTVTFATSLDSQLALSPGAPTLLSGPQSMAMTHYLRSRYDAILIGVGAAVADDPSLNCEIKGLGDTVAKD